jgi:protease-4
MLSKPGGPAPQGNAGNVLRLDVDRFEQSVQLGLADEIGSVDSVARDVIKAEKVLDYSVKDNIAERFAKRFGAGAVNGFWKGFLRVQMGTSLR